MYRIGKSVIGSDIHIEVNELFTHFGSFFFKVSQRFGFSTRSLGHNSFTSRCIGVDQICCAF